jgi:hypothetical protein
MKEIMAKESSSTEQGVPSLTYSLADETMPLLFALSRPLDDLQTLLLKHFAGQTLKMVEVYEQHNVDTPYIKKNYKDVLIKLEKAGVIEARPAKRRKGTFADDVVVTFPRRSR